MYLKIYIEYWMKPGYFMYGVVIHPHFCIRFIQIISNVGSDSQELSQVDKFESESRGWVRDRDRSIPAPCGCRHTTIHNVPPTELNLMANQQAFQAYPQDKGTLTPGQTISVNKHTVQVERYLSQGKWSSKPI